MSNTSKVYEYFDKLEPSVLQKAQAQCKTCSVKLAEVSNILY